MMALHRPSRIPFIGHFSAISRSFIGPFSVVFGRFSAISWSFLAILAQKTPFSARFSADSVHTIRPAMRPFRRAETYPATPSRPRWAPSRPSWADGGPPHGSRGRGFADYEHRRQARTSPPSSCPYQSGAHGALPRRAGPLRPGPYIPRRTDVRRYTPTVARATAWSG